jgi:outer membrane murein-binding lipoprotein Lpp
MNRIFFGLKLAATLIGLGVAGCSIQLVSPYNAELASSLTKLHEDVLKMASDVARNAADPATKANARVEAYGKTYDDWRARVDTMRVLAEIANPGIINCADLMKRLGTVGQSNVTAAEGSTAEAAQGDCQTYLIIRLRTRVDQTERLHAAACASSNPNFTNDCLHGFGTARGVIRMGDDSNALLAQPLLRSIRALIWVQDAKKPKTNASN